MNCKDLMIGDWVKVEEPTETVKARVLGVHKDGVINYEVFYSCVRATGQIHTDYVSPIPITEEILEKNGFKKVNMTVDGDYRHYHLHGVCISWEEQNGFWYGEGDIEFKYVHELQHLLRLCGIEKEIEL